MAHLVAGETATENVFLNYEGGYTDAHLVPADAPEGRGMLLVAEGDTIQEGHVQRYEQAEKYAAHLAQVAADEQAAADEAAEDAAREAAAQREADEQHAAVTTTADGGSAPAEEPVPAPSTPVEEEHPAVDETPQVTGGDQGAVQGDTTATPDSPSDAPAAKPAAKKPAAKKS